MKLPPLKKALVPAKTTQLTSSQPLHRPQTLRVFRQSHGIQLASKRFMEDYISLQLDPVQRNCRVALQSRLGN